MKKNKQTIHITRESQIRNINKIVNHVKPAFEVDYREPELFKTNDTLREIIQAQ